MKMEIWKEIKDYPNYMVLSGNISKKRQHPLKKTAIKQIYNM